MATIDDLNTSIVEMEHERLTKLFLEIRQSRRIKKKKPTSTSKTKPQKSTKSILASMSEDQKSKLIAELEELL